MNKIINIGLPIGGHCCVRKIPMLSQEIIDSLPHPTNERANINLKDWKHPDFEYNEEDLINTFELD